jgi:hypothetical protein
MAVPAREGTNTDTDKRIPMTDLIPRIDAAQLGQADFDRDYFRGNRPLVVRGAVDHWPAFRRWSPAYFESLFGDRTVPVDYSRDGFMTYTTLGKEKTTQRAELPFREASARIADPQPGQSRCYLRNVSLPHLFPELLEDFEPPALVGDPARITMNHFWYGAAGCVSALHIDWTSNFMVQVQGRKRFTVFAPSDTPYLYPAGDAAPSLETDWIDLREHSLIDIEHPDWERFPEFRLARPYVADLEPGDMLWLPPNWWHEVRTLDLSISVNFWWQPHIDQLLFMEDMVAKLPLAYRAGALENYLLGATETRDFPGLVDMAERCRVLGKPWAAVLVAATALEQHLRRIAAGRGVPEPEGPGTLRAEGLNAELARAGVAERVDGAGLGQWMALVDRALAMEAGEIADGEAGAVVAGVRGFIGKHRG